MESIFYSGIIIMAVCIAYSVLMQLSKTSERNQAISSAESHYAAAEDDRKRSRQKLMESISTAYGSEKADKVANGTIWMGMPLHLLLVANGNANEIKESFYRNNRIEKWYYGEYVNRLGNYKYTFEVTLENDEIVGWQDLK